MVYILKLNRCVYLRTKFEVFSIILTSFRRGNLVEKRTPKNPARLGFKALKSKRRRFGVKYLFLQYKNFNFELTLLIILCAIDSLALYTQSSFLKYKTSFPVHQDQRLM